MKRDFFLVLFLFVQVTGLFSQSKRDYVWTFGLDAFVEPETQAYRFDFNQVPFKPFEINHPFSISSNNASICDYNGNLLFYTNGCAIINAENELMDNGIPINSGPFLTELWGGESCQAGYPGTQNIIILSDPLNDFGYYIIHKPRSYFPDQDPATFHEEIRFTYVNMNLDSGNGSVTIRDSSFYSGDKILSNYLTGIYHQNQKYWWLLQPVEHSNRYKRFLIDSSGIHEEEDQIIGPIFHHNASASGTAKFSPDGTKYAYYNEDDGLLLFDFDRALGLLSNSRQVEVFDTMGQGIFCSVEWSPNSRFVYTATMTKLHQVDTYENNLEDGIELIDIYDGTQNPFFNTFFLMALAPDCNIYICSTSGNRTYHVINDPDKKGKDCNFIQNGLELPINAGIGSMPNFPRWRVDEEENCDPSIVSIFGEVIYYNKKLQIFPNPTSGPITIQLPENKKNGQLRITDNSGKPIYETTTSEQMIFVQFDFSIYPSGIYHIDYLPEDNKERFIYAGKVSVAR